MRVLWEKYGYIAVLCACLLVIVGAAVFAQEETVPEITPTKTPVRVSPTPFPSLAVPSPTETPESLREEFALIYPVNGKIVRGYAVDELNLDPVSGEYSTHDGVDFEGKDGESVCAAGDGTVTRVWESEKYGNCVEITHRNGYCTRYGSLGSVCVEENEWVAAGQSIGTMGKCLWENFPHLHFSLRRLSQSLYPMEFLRDA